MRLALISFPVLLEPALALAQIPLTLEEALRASEAQSPRLSAQRAMVVSAEHQAARAGELFPERLGAYGIPHSRRCACVRRR